MADTELAAEVAQLRAELAELQTRLGRQPAGLEPRAPQVNATRVDTHRPLAEPFDYDPRHSERYLAAVNANASPAELDRIEIEVQAEINSRPHPGPVSPADIRAAERRANAAGLADLHTVTSGLTMPPLQPGGTVSTSPSGQVTMSEPAEACCPSGHRRVGADLYCRLCGSEFMDAGQLRVTDESRLAARDAEALARLRAMEDLPGIFAQPSKPRTRKAAGG
jgi:hypothetical protein